MGVTNISMVIQYFDINFKCIAFYQEDNDAIFSSSTLLEQGIYMPSEVV